MKRVDYWQTLFLLARHFQSEELCLQAAEELRKEFAELKASVALDVASLLKAKHRSTNDLEEHFAALFERLKSNGESSRKDLKRLFLFALSVPWKIMQKKCISHLSFFKEDTEIVGGDLPYHAFSAFPEGQFLKVIQDLVDRGGELKLALMQAVGVCLEFQRLSHFVYVKAEERFYCTEDKKDYVFCIKVEGKLQKLGNQKLLAETFIVNMSLEVELPDYNTSPLKTILTLTARDCDVKDELELVRSAQLATLAPL